EPGGAGGVRTPVPPSAAVPASPASSPSPAGTGDPGPRQGGPGWWQEGPAPRYAEGGRLRVGGFVGGIELPEVLQPPPEAVEDGGGGDSAAAGAAGPPAPAAPAGPAARRWAARLWGARTKAAGGPRVGGAVELLAAALLVAGAVLGSLVPLGLGWLFAWWSPRLSRQEAKWAVMGVPGVVAGAALVWLWGRTEGRWGESIAQEALGEAVIASWPWALRTAAVASALFLVWRARRRPRG
ncbi:MAG TPA: hypothetical protein VFY14_09170, partial [Streptomyces sp.]|nr:hypothetical protein [Streptomyces sp.]